MSDDNKTREGNEILPAESPLRETIRGNSGSICADCRHVADLCKGLSKINQSINGYTGVAQCTGFVAIDT